MENSVTQLKELFQTHIEYITGVHLGWLRGLGVISSCWIVLLWSESPCNCFGRSSIWWKVTYIFLMISEMLQLELSADLKAGNRLTETCLPWESIGPPRINWSTKHILFVELQKASLLLFPFILRKDSVVWVARPCVGGVFSWLPKDASYTTCSVFNESTITHNWQKLSGAQCIQLEQLCCWLPWTYTYSSSQTKTSDPLH